MKIEIIGPGCPFCKKLYRRVSEVVEESKIDAEVMHVTSWKEAIKYIPRTPVLMVDGDILHRGKWLPGKEKIKALLEERLDHIL